MIEFEYVGFDRKGKADKRHVFKMMLHDWGEAEKLMETLDKCFEGHAATGQEIKSLHYEAEKLDVELFEPEGTSTEWEED